MSSSAPRPSAALRAAAPALAAYAAVRALGVLLLAAVSGGFRPAFHLLDGRWDAVWYARLVAHGYGVVVHPPDGRSLSGMAFFPLYPALEKAVSGVLGVSPGTAGLAVAWAASLAAAWGVFAVGDRLGGRRLGTALAVAWAAWPTGIVQSMAYTETLFTALAAWALHLVLRERWLGAGWLAVAAGLSRPSAAAVVCALWLGVWLAARRDGRLGRRALAGAVLAPWGVWGYMLWVGARRGSLLHGYFDVQAGWGNGFDGGVSFARYIGSRFAAGTAGGVAAGLGLVALVAVVVWLVVRVGRQFGFGPLWVYTLVLVAVGFGTSGFFGSKPRMLMPAFPLLLPFAAAAARARPRGAAAGLGAAALGAGVLGAFLLQGSGPP